MDAEITRRLPPEGTFDVVEGVAGLRFWTVDDVERVFREPEKAFDDVDGQNYPPKTSINDVERVFGEPGAPFDDVEGSF